MAAEHPRRDSLPGEAGNTNWKFDRTIQLGHIMQAVVGVGGVITAAFTIYLMIYTQLASQAQQIALLEQRVVVSERSLLEQRETLRLTTTEIRQSLDRISGQISDLRTVVASQGHKP